VGEVDERRLGLPGAGPRGRSPDDGVELGWPAARISDEAKWASITALQNYASLIQKAVSSYSL
jgi:hypothetical protein